MTKNYGDTVWNLNRPGLVIEDVKKEVAQAKENLLQLCHFLHGAENGSCSLMSGKISRVSRIHENLKIISDLLDTIPPDNGPNIQTAATKDLDQPIDVDVFANDSQDPVIHSKAIPKQPEIHHSIEIKSNVELTDEQKIVAFNTGGDKALVAIEKANRRLPQDLIWFTVEQRTNPWA